MARAETRRHAGRVVPPPQRRKCEIFIEEMTAAAADGRSSQVVDPASAANERSE
jgi:hypothetical protein